jgi:hypothetical protein
VLLVDGVHTLTIIVIVDPTWVDLVSWIFHGVVVTIMVMTKDDFYHDQFPTKIFLPLNVEVFECLH